MDKDNKEAFKIKWHSEGNGVFAGYLNDEFLYLATKNEIGKGYMLQSAGLLSGSFKNLDEAKKHAKDCAERHFKAFSRGVLKHGQSNLRQKLSQRFGKEHPSPETKQ